MACSGHQACSGFMACSGYKSCSGLKACSGHNTCSGQGTCSGFEACHGNYACSEDEFCSGYYACSTFKACSSYRALSGYKASSGCNFCSGKQETLTNKNNIADHQVKSGRSSTNYTLDIADNRHEESEDDVEIFLLEGREKKPVTSQSVRLIVTVLQLQTFIVWCIAV